MKHLFIKSEKEWIPLVFNEVKWITKSRLKKNYVSIHIHNSEVEYKTSLNSIMSILPKDEFIRVHKSYIVRLDKITKISTRLGHLKVVEKRIPIGESYAKNLLKCCHLIS